MIGMQASSTLSSHFISGRWCYRTLNVELLKHKSALLITELRATHSWTCLHNKSRAYDEIETKRVSESSANITRKSSVQSVLSRKHGWNISEHHCIPLERVKEGHVRNVVLRHTAGVVILNDHREKDIVLEDNCLWLIAVPLRPRDPETLLSIGV